MSRTILPVTMLIGVLVLPSSARAGEDKTSDARIETAKQFFAKFVSLGEAFDPAVADLYSDEARIENTRHYPDGRTSKMSFPAPQYKQLIRSVMRLARARGDLSKFSDVKYEIAGDCVRIKANRYSVLKDYFSPFSLLVGRDGSGQWVIKEELSESQP
jgi:hypothetical protein